MDNRRTIVPRYLRFGLPGAAFMSRPVKIGTRPGSFFKKYRNERMQEFAWFRRMVPSRPFPTLNIDVVDGQRQRNLTPPPFHLAAAAPNAFAAPLPLPEPMPLMPLLLDEDGGIGNMFDDIE